jgi:AAHS family cis,cis-muconate transporter-like MFS transporter
MLPSPDFSILAQSRFVASGGSAPLNAEQVLAHTIGTFMSESFATAIRGTAVGGSYNLGRFCSGVAPIVIGYIATQFSIGIGFLAVGGVFFLSGVTAFFVPDRLYDTQR